MDRQLAPTRRFWASMRTRYLVSTPLRKPRRRSYCAPRLAGLTQPALPHLLQLLSVIGSLPL